MDQVSKGKSDFQLIDWINSRTTVPRAGVIVDIGDDMAVLQTGSQELLITTDMLVEGVHFDLAEAQLEQVGYKAMACSLSDCAAMAAVPFVAVAAVALPSAMTMDQAQQLCRGLQQAGTTYDCPLVGGDITSWDRPLAIDVTMLARPVGVKPVLRSGAKIGDAIMVTGELGGSRQGRHLRFVPRVAEARTLAQRCELHAMIDLSDGLASDLRHICRQSGVAGIIDAGSVPISPAGQRAREPLSAALGDGEDFELLFCVSQADAELLQRFWPGQSRLTLTRIGEIAPIETTVGNEVILLRRADGSLEPLSQRGWEHFRE